MKTSFAVLIALLAVTARAGAHDRHKVKSHSVETFTLSAPASIHVDDSFGEVRVEGWSKDTVEVSIHKSTRKEYRPAEEAKGRAELDSVHVTTRRDRDNGLVIATVFPSRNLFTRPLRRKSNVELIYKIRVPRRSNLYIRHDIGEVQVKDVIGHIEVSSRIGEIGLKRPDREEYSVDARVKIGDVSSDFHCCGSERQHLIGAKLSEPHRTNAHQVILRLGIGDINVRKIPVRILWVRNELPTREPTLVAGRTIY